MSLTHFTGKGLSSILLLFCIIFIGCGGDNKTTVSSDPNALLIIPKERVGLIKPGMTLSEIESALGPSKDPAFGSGKQRRAYPELGLTIKLKSDGSNEVESVQCGAQDPNDALVDFCKHLTEESIGVGSSRADVITAYGQPSKIKTDWFGPTPEEGLFYDTLGVRFIITKGQVHGIIVFL